MKNPPVGKDPLAEDGPPSHGPPRYPPTGPTPRFPPLFPFVGLSSAPNRLSKSLIVPPCTREAATGRKEGDSSFVSNMYLSFNGQRTDARTVDRFIKAQLSDMLVGGPEGLPTIRKTLNGLRKDSSVEQKCQCAYDYVTKLVVASTLLKEDKNAMSRMQPMLQWVISVFLPTFGEIVFRLVGSESAETIRSTVMDLLSNISNTSLICSSSRTRERQEAVLSSSSSSCSHTAGQAVASAAQAVVGPDARPCERCYLCLRLIPVPDQLLACGFRDESPDKVPLVWDTASHAFPIIKE